MLLELTLTFYKKNIGDSSLFVWEIPRLNITLNKLICYFNPSCFPLAKKEKAEDESEIKDEAEDGTKQENESDEDENVEPEPDTTLYVKNLNFDTQEESIKLVKLSKLTFILRIRVSVT